VKSKVPIPAGGKIRLPPIAMTTLAAIMVMVPLALGIGQGSAMQKPLAIAIISGLMVQLPLVLLVLPVLLAAFGLPRISKYAPEKIDG